MSLKKSTYRPSFLFKNSHINTAYKTLFFSQKITYRRERIYTPDKDFLDLDFSEVGAKTLVIVMHGLEGSAISNYMVGAIRYLNSKKLDCVAINFRGCSGEDNRHVYAYNSGKSDDLSTVISYIIKNYNYLNIILLGYSVGGNIALKYLGETTRIPDEIMGGIAFSVPCDLEGASYALEKWYNRLYLNMFMKSLKKKGLLKLSKFPDSGLCGEAILKSQTFKDFDNAVTAPVFGFKNAEDYWHQCSSKQFLPNIKCPTLIINALDDTFISSSCYPFKEADANKNIYLETPHYGGHVGFNTSFFGNDNYWSENRVYQFIQHIIS